MSLQKVLDKIVKVCYNIARMKKQRERTMKIEHIWIDYKGRATISYASENHTNYRHMTCNTTQRSALKAIAEGVFPNFYVTGVNSRNAGHAYGGQARDHDGAVPGRGLRRGQPGPDVILCQQRERRAALLRKREACL